MMIDVIGIPNLHIHRQWCPTVQSGPLPGAGLFKLMPCTTKVANNSKALMIVSLAFFNEFFCKPYSPHEHKTRLFG